MKIKEEEVRKKGSRQSRRKTGDYDQNIHMYKAVKDKFFLKKCF